MGTQDGIGTRPQRETLGRAVGQGVELAVACLISYALITQILIRVYSVSREDDLLGGMWAVIATVFVYRESYQKSVSAAISRMSATVLSFALCLIYLLFLPFHALGMAALIRIGAVALILAGRSERDRSAFGTRDLFRWSIAQRPVHVLRKALRVLPPGCRSLCHRASCLRKIQQQPG